MNFRAKHAWIITLAISTVGLAFSLSMDSRSYLLCGCFLMIALVATASIFHSWFQPPTQVVHLIESARTSSRSTTIPSADKSVDHDPRIIRGSTSTSAGPDNRLQPLAEQTIHLIEEVEANMREFPTEGRPVARQILELLEEALVHSGVERISNEPYFDRLRHQPIGGTAREGDSILETCSSGFAIDGRVLLRAKVRVKPAA